MVSHLSFVKKISHSPEKRKTPSGAYQNLEKVKILSSPFQRHTPQPVSQDTAPPNHPNIPLSPMDVQTNTLPMAVPWWEFIWIFYRMLVISP